MFHVYDKYLLVDSKVVQNKSKVMIQRWQIIWGAPLKEHYLQVDVLIFCSIFGTSLKECFHLCTLSQNNAHVY